MVALSSLWGGTGGRDWPTDGRRCGQFYLQVEEEKGGCPVG